MENTTLIEKIPTSRPRHMRISKALLIIAVCVLYAMQISIAIPAYGIYHQKDLGDFSFPLIFSLLGVSLVFGLAAFIFAIVGALKNESPLTKTTIILKAVMIPFFAINIYLWLLLMSGMLNPFLLFGIPFVGAIGICLTYVYMLMTGLPDVIYTIIFCLKHKKRPDSRMIVGCLLCFVFIADLIGAILIHKSYKDILE